MLSADLKLHSGSSTRRPRDPDGVRHGAAQTPPAAVNELKPLKQIRTPESFFDFRLYCSEQTETSQRLLLIRCHADKNTKIWRDRKLWWAGDENRRIDGAEALERGQPPQTKGSPPGWLSLGQQGSWWWTRSGRSLVSPPGWWRLLPGPGGSGNQEPCAPESRRRCWSSAVRRTETGSQLTGT